MSTQQIMTREQVEEKYTWDLSAMYADDATWEADFEALKEKLPKLSAVQGSLSESSEQLAGAIEVLLDTQRTLSNLYVYASMKNDQDQNNSTYQTLDARAMQLYSQFSQTISFFEPELLAIEEDTLATWLEENPRLAVYRQMLNDRTRFRAHVLSKEEEMLLAQASEIFDGAMKTFGLLNNADLVFPSVQDETGQTIQLTHSLYGKLLESSDRRVRQETFQGFYTVYDQFKNTMASVLSTQIKTNNFQAKVRRFKSAREAALFQNNIPESVYDTLLETVENRLDLLHRYVNLRKNLLGVTDLEMYDMYTPLLGEAPIKFTYEEAKEITLKALAPLGEEYVSIMQEAFDDRWIDLFENKGKRSGAYSSGTYDSKPYILMNWQDNVNWLYTLVHELGHSAHSYLTHKHQDHVYGDYSIFLAEIASTTNENLLTSYLLETYTEPNVRLYVLNHFLDGLKGTMFRQTQFAEFEHFMYESDANGIPLTQQFLSENYGKMNAKYYGPAVNSDSEIRLEWARIPHFYYNYYVFQYATGFAAATAFSDRILAGEEGALDKYLGFLKSGSSQYAIDTMKTAGLDMTQRDYIDAALDVFAERLNEFETLLAEQKA